MMSNAITSQSVKENQHSFTSSSLGTERGQRSGISVLRTSSRWRSLNLSNADQRKWVYAFAAMFCFLFSQNHYGEISQLGAVNKYSRGRLERIKASEVSNTHPVSCISRHPMHHHNMQNSVRLFIQINSWVSHVLLVSTSHQHKNRFSIPQNQ